MPKVLIDIHQEQHVFDKIVAEIEAWWRSPKQAGITRPYSASQVASLRSALPIHYASSDQALKLWQQLNAHRAKGTAELTFGCTEPLIASQIIKYSSTVYVSGGLCSLSRVNEPGMDMADYPWDTVPKAADHIFRSQQWHSQRQNQYRMSRPIVERDALENWDYMAPIVADGDMGFGSSVSTMKMVKGFVEAGVAMIHIDDLAIAKKRFTIGQGRTVAPLSEYIDRLTAARLQIDIMGAETMLLCRTDNDISEFISDTTDERDHEYIMGATVPIKSLRLTLVEAYKSGIHDLAQIRRDWIQSAHLSTFDDAVKNVATSLEFEAYVSKLGTRTVSIIDRKETAAATVRIPIFFDWDLGRSRDGQYFYQSSLKAVLERCLAVQHLGEVTWARMDSPTWSNLNSFYASANASMPGRLFAFGYTGTYDWEKAMSIEEIKTFPQDLAKHGVVWQVQPTWAAAGTNLAAEQFAKLWSERGIEGYYEEIQKPLLASRPRIDGFQKPAYSGAFLADAFHESINGSDYT